MHLTLRVPQRPIRIRLRSYRVLRVTLVRWLRARLREASPVIDRSGIKLRGPM